MSKRGRPPHPEVLTPREQEVLALLREELSNDEIAQRLGISEGGVKYHVTEILSKLGLENRWDAARWQPGAQPWWSAAFAPLLFWRKIDVGALSPVIAGGLAIAVAAGIGVLVWALLATSGDGGTLTLAQRDKLAYIGTDGNLWVLEGEGPARRLTDTHAVMNPAWSPDGRWIAYTQPSNEPLFWELRVTDTQGSSRLITSSRWGIGRFAWSPDGDHFAYMQRMSPTGGHTLSVINTLAFGDVSNLSGEFGVVDFAWSPDGKKLAVARSRPDLVAAYLRGTPEAIGIPPYDGIYIIDATGGEPEPLLLLSDLSIQSEGMPLIDIFDSVGRIRWSPDGRNILFQSNSIASVSLAADGLQLYSLSIDGSSLVQHGTMLRSWKLLGWNPDGETFVFTLHGGRDLYFGKQLAVAEPGVAGATVISQPFSDSTGRSDAHPALSPDGARIAFQASEEGDSALPRLNVGKIEGPLEGIWIVGIDGESQRQLTADAEYLDFNPQWSADGRQIMFVRTDGQPFGEDAADASAAHAEVWLMRPDGSDAEPLVTDLVRITSYYGLFDWGNYVVWYRAPAD